MQRLPCLIRERVFGISQLWDDLRRHHGGEFNCAKISSKEAVDQLGFDGSRHILLEVLQYIARADFDNADLLRGLISCHFEESSFSRY